MNSLLQRVVQTVIVLIGIVTALDLAGATSMVGAVLGSAGVVGLALGFAFKDIAENYIAGILLSVRRPFAPGEHVKIDAYEGKVVALTSRATIMMTLDGNQLRLPNALVFKSVLLNYSQNAQRRFDFVVTIDGTQSIRQSQTLALEAISKIEGVLSDPAPSWTVVENKPAGIGLQFFGWVDQRVSDLGKVRSEAIRSVKSVYAEAGIEGPRTVYHVVSSREDRNGIAAAPATEAGHGGDIDTSVNRDIDDQLAAAQRADESQNLLQPGDKAE
jgi:small-conductance mechanosensitive channel